MDTATFEAATAMKRWPSNTSQEYVEARNQLLKEEYELRTHIDRITALRRALPSGAIMPAYTFDEGPLDLHANEPTKKTTLADLAQDGRSVIIYHFMFDPADTEPCSHCAMMVNNCNGVGKHLAEHINFAIVGKAPLDKLRASAQARGWTNLRFLSSFENSFNADMNVERPEWAKDAKQLPGMSVFRKDDQGQVRHVYTTYPFFNPGNEKAMDMLYPVWNFLDLVPEAGEYDY